MRVKNINMVLSSYNGYFFQKKSYNGYPYYKQTQNLYRYYSDYNPNCFSFKNGV